MDGVNTSVRDLDLPPGYYAERSEAETYLIDPEGRRVMRLPPAARYGVEEPTNEEWRALSRALLVQLSEQTAECERLRGRVSRLEERAEAAEAERDQANAIAEDLYGFFRRRVREVVDRKSKPGNQAARWAHEATTSRLSDSQDAPDRGGGV